MKAGLVVLPASPASGPAVTFDAEFGLIHRRKLCVTDPLVWDHHYDGWKAVVALIEGQLHTPDGVSFVSSVEDMLMRGTPIQKPWVGFVHQAPRNGLRWFPDLERLGQHPVWIASAPFCRGVFVLSDYVKDYLKDQSFPVPVNRVYYPFRPVASRFSPERFARTGRKMLFVGEYLRDVHAFYEVEADGYRKVLLRPATKDTPRPPAGASVELLERVADEDYDRLLTESVVFLALFDSPANTTVLECIARCTPVLVNRLPALVEYLGPDYPLFYESLSVASELAADPHRLEAAHRYLATYKGRDRLTPEHFLRSLQDSAIYRSLPVPPAEAEFRRFDATVVICSYARVKHLPDLLARMAVQDFTGTFEVILWNNNAADRERIDRLCKALRGRLELTVIHSSQNFYCVVRQAAASLMRSEVMVVCDDDVKPEPTYLATFMEKRCEYGDDAVLCCRGHVFRPHELDEESPHRVWQDYEHLEFFDETGDDRQVHFFHADNCLIPRQVMLRALQHSDGPPENALVDDYWLSFVFSHHLGVPIWKIKGSEIMKLHPTSDDASIALFHNPRVIEQRINFYVEHMRAGWPPHTRVQRAASARRCGESAAECWRRGFRGVNVSCDVSDDDLAAAAAYGVGVVRAGVTGGGQDGRFLVDAVGERFVWNDESQRRLVGFVERAARHGIRVVLTLNHIPGRLFGDANYGADLRIWHDPVLRERFVEMWGCLAEALLPYPNVIGFDLLNEPFLPADLGRGEFDEVDGAGMEMLHELYRQAAAAVHSVDPERIVILESSRWASPVTLPLLEPVNDPRMVYSFHFYMPHMYTSRARNQGRFAYPGLVPAHDFRRWAECRYWDREELRTYLTYIHDWQKDYNLPSSRVFVGEFGVTREARGAAEYLDDLASLFAEFGWSWTAYAFREWMWDAMDYELGSDAENMLTHSSTPLFQTLARHFA